MPTATKSKIDQEVEGGAILLAEDILPPSEERLALALQLEGTWRTYTDTRGRVDAAIERQEAIARELPKAPDQSTRKALIAERAELTSELLHAPADTESAAVRYADDLGRWATATHHAAKVGYRGIASEEQPLRQARRKIHDELSPELPANKKTGDDLTRLNEKFASLSEQIGEMGDRRREFEEVASRASATVRKFGETIDTDLFNQSGKRRWIAGVRDAVARRTVGLTGVGAALKPRSF